MNHPAGNGAAAGLPRTHPAREFNTNTGLLQVDVLAVEMPSAPQERRLYGQLLIALNAPYRPGGRLAAVVYTALTLLRKVAPRMIVVDEVHNLLAGLLRWRHQHKGGGPCRLEAPRRLTL